MNTSPIFCALDLKEVEATIRLVDQLKGHVGGIKLGLEFFLANGPQGLQKVREKTGIPIFIDLKLHDIPNTVKGAVESLMPLRPHILTVHTQGGKSMMRSAAEAAREMAAKQGYSAPKIVGVTVLTSLDQSDMASIGVDDTVNDQVLRLASLARKASLDGVVCSPREVALLRKEQGSDFMLVVPGIRPAGSKTADQKRIMTPTEAISAGADILVIGRPITGSENPVAAAMALNQEIQSGQG